MEKPRIADVQCSKIRFDPGDKILVRTTHRLTSEEKNRLTKSISKWAGADVDVFIYCILDMEMIMEKKGLTSGG